MAVPNPLDPAQSAPKSAGPTRREAFWFWFKLGWISFGGPTGQIAIMHHELVERRRWVSSECFLHALNYCVLLPGPEAQQLAIYLGWVLHGTRGGVLAGVFFVLPSAVLLWVLSWIYVRFGEVGWVAAAFDGLKPAVLAIVAVAALKLGRKVLRNGFLVAVAILGFLALRFFSVPFPAVIAVAAMLGAGSGVWFPNSGRADSTIPPSKESASASEIETPRAAVPRPPLSRAFQVLGTCLTVWWAPILAAAVLLGRDHILVQQGLFFSKAAVVTFGGAYAVLPYVSQQAVTVYGWVDPHQMIDGLGLAETTPGPLIMVLQFVGFLGGWKFPAPFSPWLGATLAAAMTTWVTFVPCFLWILLGAPYVDRLRGNARLDSVLSVVTAAVVGVIANLAVWFAQHALFPDGTHVDVFAVGVAGVAFVGLWRWRWNVAGVILGGALLAVLRHGLGWGP